MAAPTTIEQPVTLAAPPARPYDLGTKSEADSVPVPTFGPVRLVTRTRPAPAPTGS